MKKELRPIMFVGTGSDVGKSLINAGFCRIFKQDGYAPAPFKAQNMSLNSYATADELEIGRAQAVQAEACGVACQVEMNPVLLKPCNDQCAQVVLLGKPIGTESAKEYFQKPRSSSLFSEVTSAFDRLASRHNPIVLEGAGSISEMNLWDRDIVNMSMAKHAQAATYLIADIDKGGVFASVYGSLALLPEDERALIKGVIINKFRGDIELFNDGRKMLENLTGVPVVGVVPHLRELFIEQEDAVVLDSMSSKSYSEGDLRICVVLLPRMSNFTDFNLLSHCDGIHLSYSCHAQDLAEADVIIIPGSKSTIGDLEFIRQRGLEEVLLAHHRAGKALYGICGGFQMMGESIHDPEGIEGTTRSVKGLGIFPISTTIESGKVTRQCAFRFIHGEAHGRAYEIHAGSTPTSSPLTTLSTGEQEGYYKSQLCWGSYLHGIFDSLSVIQTILHAQGRDSSALEGLEDYHEMKDRHYDQLAHELRRCIDMDQVYASMQV